MKQIWTREKKLRELLLVLSIKLRRCSRGVQLGRGEPSVDEERQVTERFHLKFPLWSRSQQWYMEKKTFLVLFQVSNRLMGGHNIPLPWFRNVLFFSTTDSTRDPPPNLLQRWRTLQTALEYVVVYIKTEQVREADTPSAKKKKKIPNLKQL